MKNSIIILLLFFLYRPATLNTITNAEFKKTGISIKETIKLRQEEFRKQYMNEKSILKKKEIINKCRKYVSEVSILFLL